MFILRLILLVLGLILIGFGYLIYFKKKYNLINTFKEDLKLNKVDESYGIRIGLIELIWGIIFIVIFLITCMIPDYSIGFFLIGVLGLIITLVVYHLKLSRNELN